MDVLVEDVVHAFDPVAPLVAQPVEGDLDVVEGVGSSADVAMSMLGPLRDQACRLEDGDVALDRSERHGIRVRELRDGVFAVQRAGHDVTPCRVGERTQLPVEGF